jgi:two-component system sensor histidine kinase PilS (NtrC family)
LLLVVLLEDVRTAQARLQQEKLAAMGRVSAGVAHEIRNPLAAIAQANALLLEDELNPGQQRLAQMVDDNVRRLKRLVDDVMEGAPGNMPQAGSIDARLAVAQIVADWARTANVAVGGSDGRLLCEWPDDEPKDAHDPHDLHEPSQPLNVAFDGEHLRRVLVNLLDNALRHTTAMPGAVVLRLRASGASGVGGAVLTVCSDSEPIAADVQPYLFEPFYSTRSRGSGLGLYICRELCERYGGSIEYRSRPATERWRNEFVVSLPLAAAAPPPSAVAPGHPAIPASTPPSHVS